MFDGEQVEYQVELGDGGRKSHLPLSVRCEAQACDAGSEKHGLCIRYTCPSHVRGLDPGSGHVP